MKEIASRNLVIQQESHQRVLLKYTTEEVRQIDQRTRKLMNHKTDCMCQKKGGRGLANIENSEDASICGLR